MLTPGPTRARQSYRHEAFLWNSDADYVDGLVPFIEDGLDADEAVMVAATPEHGEWVFDGLGSKASRVHFVDITELGRNPARIIPACHQFLQDWCGYGRPARAIGEALWDGRRADEVVESQLHEALMNLAVDPELPFWVLCPYDAEHIGADVLAEVSRSHPALATADSYQGSRSYRGHDHARALFAADLPSIEGPVTMVDVAQAGLAATAETVGLQAACGGLRSHQVVSLVDAVRRLAGDSLTRNVRPVTVRLWDRPEALICEVADSRVVRDLLVGRRPPQRAEDDAVWWANQVCDLVQVRSSDLGSVVRLHMWKTR